MERINTKRLTYKRAILNFTFTFSWDVTKASFNDIANDVKEDNDWNDEFLYNRPLCHNTEISRSSYHPNLASNSLKVLHRLLKIDENITLVDNVNNRTFNAVLNNTIRIHETGICTSTFSVILDKPTFVQIHLATHLASTVSKNPEEQSKKDVFIKNKKSENYPYSKDANISLISFFNDIIKKKNLPKIFYDLELDFDKHTINANNDEYKDWQTPYLTTFLEVESEVDYYQFVRFQDKTTLKEITSIAGRLSIDNDKIESDFDKITREYIFRSYGSFNLRHKDKRQRRGRRIKNYSHHKDLYYSIDKRGAFAVTPSFENNPSYFVLPSLMNLVEILRSRWHLGSIVNLRLDELFEQISEDCDLEYVQNEIYKCRRLYGMFLKDPAPYLFDSGAITEIAETGDSIFWLVKLASQMKDKLNIIDDLLGDIYKLKRYKDI